MAPTTMTAASMLLLIAALMPAFTCGANAADVETVTFSVRNAASGTAGGRIFDKEVGAVYAHQVLSHGSVFVWNAFRQATSADRRPVRSVSLVVVVDHIEHNLAATTVGSEVRLSAQFLAAYHGNVKEMVTGVLYHELTRVWQWDAQGHANPRLLQGIADLVQLRSGHAPARFAKAGEGSRWDDRQSGVTARFLDHLDNLKPGFLAQLNASIKTRYSDSVFSQIMGKSVDQLWNDYKAAYAPA